MTNIVLRRYQSDDLRALVDIYNACADAEQLDERTTPQTLLNEFTYFHAVPETDGFIATNLAGQILGYAYAGLNREQGWGWGWGNVRLTDQRRGIGTRLLQAVDTHFSKRAHAECASAVPLYSQRYLADTQTAAAALVTAQGYRKVRSSYRLDIQLTAPIDVPALPAGLTLHPFDRERDAHRVYAADQEAFADSGDVLAQMPYATWVTDYLDKSDFNPALWLIAYEGDEIAGVCLSRADGEIPNTGWISHVAVRRPWRKRGLGLALLKRSFEVIRQHGYGRAALGVRGDNQTNPIALYERAGMRVYLRYDVYRKLFRGEDNGINT